MALTTDKGQKNKGENKAQPEIDNSFYQHLSKSHKNIAVKIEHLLNGLSLEDAQNLIDKVSREIPCKAILKSV